MFNGKLKRVPDDWHVTADFGGGPNKPESAHIYAGPDMEKGKKDVSIDNMGIHRPEGRAAITWFDIRDKSPFAQKYGKYGKK